MTEYLLLRTNFTSRNDEYSLRISPDLPTDRNMTRSLSKELKFGAWLLLGIFKLADLPDKNPFRGLSPLLINLNSSHGDHSDARK